MTNSLIKNLSIVSVLAVGTLSFTGAQASSFTQGTLPSAVSAVGGVVLDLTGINGNRVVTQAAASTLFVGDAPSSNPLVIGSQSGFNPAIFSALGGGLSSAFVRISLYDGDSQPGNFDYLQNTLSIGSSYSTAASFGNFSTVVTQETDGSGNAISGLTKGFGDDILDTGFFQTTDLAQLYNELSVAAGGNGVISFYLTDQSPGDQFYDFTQGLDSGVINVGTGPIVTPPVSTVPLPASAPLFGAAIMALGALGYSMRRGRVAAA